MVRALVITGFLIGSGVLTYIGLTQTEVGRDFLRQEIESQFAEAFYGQLKIGAVTGNLQQTIYLQDVSLYDERQHLWLHVNQITARPNWFGVFGSRFELSSLLIDGPTLSLEYLADSTWNLSSVLSSRKPGGSQSWDFESAHVEITNGRIHLSYQEHVPKAIESGWVFDFAATEVSDFSLEGHIHLQSDRKIFTIESLTASVDTLDVGVDGEFVLERDRLFINSLNVSSSDNQASVVGVFSMGEAFADLSLIDSYFTPEFIRAVSPEVKFFNSLSIQGNIHREASQWLFNETVITTPLSRIEIPSASIESDGNQLTFGASIAPTTINPQDLSYLMDTSQWRAGKVQVDGRIQGSRTMNQLDLDGTLDILTSTGGRSNLVASVQRSSQWSYEGHLTTSNLNLSVITGESDLQGVINGEIHLAGSGLRSPTVASSITLSSSEIAGRSIDSLSMEGSLKDQKLSLSGTAHQKEAKIHLDLTADLKDDAPLVQASGHLVSADLGHLLSISNLQTDFNAAWEISGSGRQMDDFSGQLLIQTDSSTIAWNQAVRAAPPTQWLIHLHESTTPQPRLTVEGDVIDLEISGDIRYQSFKHIGTVWAQSFEQMLDRFSKHFQPLEAAGLEDYAQLYQSEDDAGESSTLGLGDFLPIDLYATWELHAHPATSALLFLFPSFHSQHQGEVHLQADGESLFMHSQIIDEWFEINDFAAYQPVMTFTFDASLSDSIETDWTMGVNLAADSITTGQITTRMPSLSWNQVGRKGTLELLTDIENSSIQSYLSSEIQLLRDRIRLRIEDMRIPVGDAIWTIAESADLDVYAGTAIFRSLRLATVSPFLDQAQTMTVQGRLSSMPEDTLSVTLEGVDLGHLSSIFEFRRPLGGVIDANLRWTGLWLPEITGSLDIDTLTFDNKMVGHVQALSTLLPGSSDIKVAMVIDSLEADSTPYIPASNQIELIGNLVIGDRERTRSIDLFADIERLDAGFLDILFRDPIHFQGGFSGDVLLQGPFEQLILDGALDWTDGELFIPELNTLYEATGSFSFERDQIHANQLMLNDPYGGTAQVAGILDLNEFQFLSFDASASTQSLQIINVLSHTSDLSFYGDIRVSGDATLTGPVYSSSLRSDNLVVTPQSEVYIPVRETSSRHDPGFIIYVDSTQSVETQLASVSRPRETILERRPIGERKFGDGLDMDLNLVGPPGSSIGLVIDPLLGDIINGIGSARVQLQRTGGEMSTYGSFDLTSGDYLFTAGEIFVRRFLIDSGTITWNGPPLNPALEIHGAYRTRASRSGLPEDVGGAIQNSLPLIVNLYVSGTLNAVLIDLGLEVDQRQEAISDTPLLDSYLNRPDLATEHATSVLLTNSFLLSANATQGGVFASSAVNSVSSLVASQLNRYLSQVIPQADLQIGVQSDETVQDLDFSAGLALRLLNERLIIRGQGVYRGLSTEDIASQGLEGEFIVEIQLNPSVSVEFFYRREGDVLSESLINTEAGLGINYRTEFTSWRQLFRRTPSASEDVQGDSD